MPDMLARLYDLPGSTQYSERGRAECFTIRRAEPWDRGRMRRFAESEFSGLWALEADRAFNRSPITAYVATQESEIVGFAVYECTRRDAFMITGSDLAISRPLYEMMQKEHS